MKRWLLCMAAVLIALLCLTACKNESDYTPVFELGEGYTLNGDVISGTVVGNEYVSLFSVFTTYDRFVIFGDSSAETFLESGIIPLKKGNNRLVIRFIQDGEEREYDLHIEYIPIRSFSVEILDEEKTYHIGEEFDKSTIRVIATTESGELVTVENYYTEYEFSELGEADVGIELGDMYESITVMVTEEYLPTLDGRFSADGVTYVLRGEEAVLLSAEEIEGFYAVPRAVVYDGKEYPVTEIGNGAFSRTMLTSVLIPEGVKKLSTGVFSGCEYLTSVELPDSVISIGKQAFSDCVSLDRVVLPEALEKLEYGTFSGCESLFRITLPDALTVIGERAFADCQKLKTVNFSKGLAEIGNEAFADCISLNSVVLGNLQRIGDGAFKNCEKLTSFAMADAVFMGEDIFEGANVTVYTAMTGRVLSYVATKEIPYVLMQENVPCLVTLPTEFAIEDEYPYNELFALVLLGDTVSALTDYEVLYAADACGELTATLIWKDFSHSFPIFVSYTETVLTDTDTRGARYELDPLTKTAMLVYLPEYVKPSKIYASAQEGLFIVPTTLSCPDGDYTVIGILDGASEECQNVSAIFMPKSLENL